MESSNTARLTSTEVVLLTSAATRQTMIHRLHLAIYHRWDRLVSLLALELGCYVVALPSEILQVPTTNSRQRVPPAITPLMQP